MKDHIFLTWKKSRICRIILILECLIILALLPGCFRTGEKTAVYEGEGTGEIALQNLSFGPGVYEVTVDYRAAEGTSSVISVAEQEYGRRRLYVNDIPLPGELGGRQFRFWITSSSDTVSITTVPGEGSGLDVTGIWVQKTAAGGRIGLLTAAAVFLLADGLYLYGAFLAGRPDGRKKALTAIGLVTVIMVVSVPLMTDYLINGMDLIFHLIRIEGVKEGLAGGQFPVRIQPNWLNGHGYAASVFYGDTFLVIPALLRMVGFSIQTAYKLFLLIVNAATALIAYTCLKRCFRDEYLGLLGSMLYTWSPYRIYDLYGRAALGETLALCFLPVLFYGFYRIFTEDIHDKEYRRLWILPAAGFTCLIQSHTLSCEMMGAMVVLLCVILWKRVLRRQTFVVLCKAVGATVLLNAWFLAPFLSYLLQGGFKISQAGGESVQYRGIYPAHFLFTFFRNGSSSHTNEMGMQQTESLGVGFAITLCVLLYLWQLFTGRCKTVEERGDKGFREESLDKEDGKIVFYAKISAVLGGVFLVLSTNSFPWDWLQKQNRVFAFLIGSLQFPMRLLTVVLLCFTFVACAAVWQVRRRESAVYAKVVMAVVMGTALVTTQYLTGDTLFTESPLKLYNEENMGTTYVIGGEYLPVETNTAELAYGSYTAGDGVELAVTDGQEVTYGKRNLSSAFQAVNRNGGESYVEVPLLYYEGYRAMDGEGNALDVEMGENGRVRVCLPEGFGGSVKVFFEVPGLWRAAEAVTAVSVLVFLVMGLIRRFLKGPGHHSVVQVPEPGKEAAHVEEI